MKRYFISCIVVALMALPGCVTTGTVGKPAASNRVPPISRTAAGADPAIFEWEVRGNTVKAKTVFEEPQAPGMDVIGGYVDSFRVKVNGKEINLDREVMERKANDGKIVLFAPAVEMDLVDRGEAGFSLELFTAFNPQTRVSFGFDWDGNLRD